MPDTPPARLPNGTRRVNFNLGLSTDERRTLETAVTQTIRPVTGRHGLNAWIRETLLVEAERLRRAAQNPAYAEIYARRVVEDATHAIENSEAVVAAYAVLGGLGNRPIIG